MAKSKSKSVREIINEMSGDIKTAKLSPDTPQTFSFLLNGMSEGITKRLNEYAYRQNDPEVARLYISWQQSIATCCKFAKTYLPDSLILPDLPILIGNDYYAGLIHLRDFCEKVRDSRPAIPPKAEAAIQNNKELSMAKMVRIYIDQNPKITFPDCKKRVNVALKTQGKTVSPNSIRNAFYDYKKHLRTKFI